MARVFDEITAGYYQPFSIFTREQESCRKFTIDRLDDLLSTRQRDKFIKDVKVCVAGLGTADEEEPLEDANFSQFQFYRPFTEDIVFFEDKFDFLIKCVAFGVCRVQPGFEDRYMHSLLKVLTFRELAAPTVPEQVLDLRQMNTPRTIGEEPGSPEKQQEQFDSYRTRRRSFANNIREELAQLEAEQRAAEVAKYQRAQEPEKPVEWGEKGIIPEEEEGVNEQVEDNTHQQNRPNSGPRTEEEEVRAGLGTMVTAKELLKQKGEQERLRAENEERERKQKEEDLKVASDRSEVAAAADSPTEVPPQAAAAAGDSAGDEPSEEEKKQLINDFNKDQKAMKVLGLAQKRKLAQRRANKEEDNKNQSERPESVEGGVKTAFLAKEKFKEKGEEQKKKEEEKMQVQKEPVAAETPNPSTNTASTVVASNGEVIETPYLDLLASFGRSPQKEAAPTSSS